MEKIYFDKQIFSYLYKGVDIIYKEFLSDLLNNKDKFLYCYSHAHLLDLKNDKSKIKYEELDFIEKLVNENYLSYHAIEKKTSCYLVKPQEAFKDIEKDDEQFSFLTIFDDFDLSFATQEQKDQISQAKRLFSEEKFDFGLSHIQKLPSELKDPLRKIFPVGLDSMTLKEWIEYPVEVSKLLKKDKTVYKGLRKVIDKHVNNGKFTIDCNSIDFNEDLKNSLLQKSFIEYVLNNINPNGDREITNYDFYTSAYFNLDILGISKEPAKKVKFHSVLNDGFHSYYGAFCDYVVSSDQGFLKKTRALYKLLEIETNVYHIDEFISHFSVLTDSFEDDINVFFKLLRKDIRNGTIIKKEELTKLNRIITVIKPLHKYLGYFNSLEIINENNQEFILLRRKIRNYSYSTFFKQYEGLINRAIKLFGNDFENKGNFIWDIEIEEINQSKWKGRFWDFESVSILIEINESLKELCMLIKVKEISS